MRMVLCFILMLIGVQQAAAHAMLMGTEPNQGAVIDHNLKQIVLNFMEPVSVLKLSLISPTSTVEGPLNAKTVGNDLQVDIPPDLDRGTYLLSWRVIGRDPHPASGILNFSMYETSETPSVPAHDSNGLEGFIWIVQLLLNFGLFVGIGGVLFRFCLAEGIPLPKAAGFVIRFAAGLSAVTAIMLAVLSALEALEVSWEGLASGPALLRGVLLTKNLEKATMVSGAVFFALAAGKIGGLRAGRLLAVAAVFLASGAIAIDVHTSANVSMVFSRAVLFVHALSLMFWVGALVPLGALLLSSGSKEPLRRFSAAIPAFLVLLLLSGATLAGVHVQSVAALLTTDFGLVLLVKLLFFLLLLSIAAYNRFFLTSRIFNQESRASRFLASFVGLEILLVLAILGIAGVWRYAPPTIPGSIPQPLVAGMEYGEISAIVSLSPGFEKARALSVSLLGSGSAAEVRAMAVTATPENARATAIHRNLTHTKGNVWEASGLYLPVPGRWTLSFDVETRSQGILQIRHDLFVTR